MASNGDDAKVRQEVTARRDAYTVGVGNITTHTHITPSDSQKVEDQLAQLALSQAQDARSALIGTDTRGDETANVKYARIPGRLREPEGRDIGDLRSILEYYQSLSPGRLVVIGAPGAGKTVLLLELQIRLLEERHKNPETPIPVLVSASVCDTTKKWDDWLAGHLSLRFSIPERTTANLVANRRILPMVDGLDEMDPAGDSIPERAQALVRALNDSMQGLERAPAVVTCRPGEYGRLAEDIDKARHVELSGLTADEAADYLNGQFRTIAERDRWKPVLDTLKRDPGGPLAEGLATPWRLALALAAFRNEGDPAQLLPTAGTTDARHFAHVDDILQSSYVSSVVSPLGEDAPHTEPNVRNWLTSLADDLSRQAHHGRSATDITLHEWSHPRKDLTARISHAILTRVQLL